MNKRFHVVGIAGSLSRTSSTAAVVAQALSDMPSNVETSLVALTDISPDALLGANTSDALLRDAIEMVEAADGIVLGTPVYKASLSGLLKVFIDHLPQYGLAGKVVWPIGTGGSLAHALALDYGVRPIVQSMGARQIIQSCFFTPADLAGPESLSIGERLHSNPRYMEALQHFSISLRMRQPLALLGHPVPERAPERITA
jgi:FMN reductase